MLSLEIHTRNNPPPLAFFYHFPFFREMYASLEVTEFLYHKWANIKAYLNFLTLLSKLIVFYKGHNILFFEQTEKSGKYPCPQGVCSLIKGLIRTDKIVLRMAYGGESSGNNTLRVLWNIWNQSEDSVSSTKIKDCFHYKKELPFISNSDLWTFYCVKFDGRIVKMPSSWECTPSPPPSQIKIEGKKMTYHENADCPYLVRVLAGTAWPRMK